MAVSLDRLIARRHRCLREIARIDARISRAVCRELMGDDLTVRERQVLALVARDFGNKQIAAELHVTERTAKFHVSNLLGKLRLNSRRQLAALGKAA